MHQAKRYGKLGGLATARKHGSEFCQARAEKAGLAYKVKYGSEFFSRMHSSERLDSWLDLLAAYLCRGPETPS
jgi:hypothetical protein